MEPEWWFIMASSAEMGPVSWPRFGALAFGTRLSPHRRQQLRGAVPSGKSVAAKPTKWPSVSLADCSNYAVAWRRL